MTGGDLDALLALMPEGWVPPRIQYNNLKHAMAHSSEENIMESINNGGALFGGMD